MADGDIARSRVADLPSSVNDSSAAESRVERDTDWPAGEQDSGKPPDVESTEPMIDLGMGPNEQPLSPDVRRAYEKLNLSPVDDAISTAALVANLL